MGKSRAPEIDEEGLAEYRARHDLYLEALRALFVVYEDQRRTDKLPTTYIALAVLDVLLRARKSGYSDDELRSIWPNAWGNGQVTVPASFLEALSCAWSEYKDDVPGKTFGEVLKLEGGGQGKSRIVSTRLKRDKHMNLGLMVANIYTSRPSNVKRPTLEQAIAAVAEEYGVSIETVKVAFKKYGRPAINKALRVGFLKGGNTS